MRRHQQVKDWMDMSSPDNTAKAPDPPRLDPERIRPDFPILQRQAHGKPLIYLDNAATTQKPEAVVEAMADFYRQHNANVHRGVYALSVEATDRYEAARKAVAEFIHAPDCREVVFTRGTTEAINLVAASWGATHLGPGDAVLLTEMEHHSNLVPWQLLQSRTGCELRFIPFDGQGMLDLDAAERLIDERVKLVAFVHVSNMLGTVNPVGELVALARASGSRVLVDAAQSVPHRPVDVQALGADFVAFSGHKMAGPTGIGVLWARREILESMPPYQGGGEMIRRVTLTSSTYAPPPARFEAGTPPVAEAIGLHAAIRYLSDLGMEAVWRHEQELVEYALAALTDVSGVKIYGPQRERGGLVSFNLEGVHPHDVASVLDHYGIAIRAGHHCTMPLHARLGIPASARASFYIYNSTAEVDALVGALREARRLLGPSDAARGHTS